MDLQAVNRGAPSRAGRRPTLICVKKDRVFFAADPIQEVQTRAQTGTFTRAGRGPVQEVVRIAPRL